MAYPGTDSPPWCGPNSEYSVTYTVVNSALVVAVPGVIGLSPTEAAAAFTGAKLTVETTPIVTHSTEDPLPEPRVINQSPARRYQGASRVRRANRGQCSRKRARPPARVGSDSAIRGCPSNLRACVARAGAYRNLYHHATHLRHGRETTFVALLRA